MLMIMFLTTFDVVLRKVIGYSIPSLFAITADYFMVGLVFLSISYVYRVGGHVSVKLFENLMPPKLRLVLNKVHEGLAFIFFGLITVAGFNAAVSAFEHREISSSLLAYPLAPALFMVPLGGALTCIRIFQSIFDSR